MITAPHAAASRHARRARALALVAAAAFCIRGAPAAAAEAVWKDGADFTRPRRGVSSPPLHVGTAVRAAPPRVELARHGGPLTPLGGEMAVAEGPAKVEDFALASAPSTGLALAVWSSADEIRGQLLGGPGREAPGAGRVLAPAGTSKGRVAVAWSPKTRRWLVAWHQSALGQSLVRGRFVDLKGAPAGKEFAISDPYNYLANPAVAYSETSGLFLVVWQEQVRDGWDIRGRRIGDDGLIREARDIVVCAAPGVQSDAHVSWSREGDAFLVVWGDRREIAAGEIFAVALGSGGAAPGPEMNVSPTLGFKGARPAAAWLAAAGKYLVVWEGYQGRATAIRGRTLTPGGAIGPELQISGGVRNQVRPIAVADESAAQWIVAWRDGRVSYDHWGLYAASVGAGESVSGELRVTDAATAVQDSAVAWDAHERLLLAGWSRRGRDRGALAWRRVGGPHVADGSVSGLRVDGGSASVRWKQVRWGGSAPAGTEVSVRARSARGEKELADAAWSELAAQNPLTPAVAPLRWLELELRLHTEEPAVTPEVGDLRVEFSRR